MNKIIVFENTNLSGASRTITTEDANLVPQGWNDRISSLIVINGNWDLYKDVEFKGDGWNVSATGGPSKDGVYNDWSDWRGTNDSISSLRPR